MKYSDFDKRMKGYEKCASSKLTPKCPVIIRLDGKAFHTYTKSLKDENSPDPFNEDLKNAFVNSCIDMTKHMQGVKAIYTQSDEVSILLTDKTKSYVLDGWFDFKVQKIVSISSSLLTYYFNKYMVHPNRMPAFFDARVFSLPDEDEVKNYFVWRQNDASRNSVSMMAQHHFSHKSLQNVSRNGMQEKLWSEKNINWNDLETWKKRGSLMVKREKTIMQGFDHPYRGFAETKRKKWEVVECPIFTKKSIIEVIDEN
jgi:tRNA(His) guanylyltransferase